MNNLTCVVDATTLVDNIHELKRWVHEGTIRLAIPVCSTFGDVRILVTRSNVRASHRGSQGAAAESGGT